MSKLNQLKEIINDSKYIVIAQADNPDGDSLASALALEDILHRMGKEPYMYCAVDMPNHLRHLSGWDRVNKDMPKTFDAGIIVDTSSRKLFEIADKNGELQWILAKPLIVIDHHDIKSTIDATVNYSNVNAVSTGEVIYDLAKQLDWPLTTNSGKMIATSILSDSLGLMTEQTTPKSIRIIADLVELGVNLPEMEEARRAAMKKSEALVRYKGKLLQRIEYFEETSIATVTIPWEEIEKYSPEYNPSILVLDDMRLTQGTKVAIAFKTYPNNRITAKIRANYGYPIAQALAEHFGGGGHKLASGFKVNNSNFDLVKKECIEVASQLLKNM
ncbi:DHH family phosphoesterase [Candidatus Saccharibacteria bacterium]|nr:DHH family phosphoesterase [Candidatus Saccharibacteria bacterium]